MAKQPENQKILTFNNVVSFQDSHFEFGSAQNIASLGNIKPEKKESDQVQLAK